MHLKKPAACDAVGWHLRPSSLQSPTARQARASVLQRAGATFMTATVDGTQPFSVSTSGLEVSEATHGAPSHRAPAAMESKGVQLPSQVGSPLKSFVGGPFAEHDTAL